MNFLSKVINRINENKIRKHLNRYAEPAVETPTAPVEVRVELTDQWYDNRDGDNQSTYEIYPYVDGKEAGYMDFLVHEYEEEPSKNNIELIGIGVHDDQKGKKLSYEIYKKFSEFYMQNYSTYPIRRLFQNPVAEYAFRKAVSDGVVDPAVLQNSQMNRDYKSQDKKDQWNDLRGKLPEQYQGTTARLRDLRTVTASIRDLRTFEAWAIRSTKDLRKIAANEVTEPNGEIDVYSEKGSSSTQYVLTYLVDGKEVAELIFEAFKQTQTLDITGIAVGESEREKGIATKLYEKFGELYTQDFNGWNVKRWFTNPVAEYAFRRAVSEGKIPQEALQEHNIRRTYDNEDPQVIKDLRGKLPQNVQGPEVWAIRDFRKIIAEKKISNLEIIVVDQGPRGEYSVSQYILEAYIDGKKIGYLAFQVYKDIPANIYIPTASDDEIIENLLSVIQIGVFEEYQNSGVGTELYKKFGELYDSKFSGWPVARYFTNPVAEYAFRKAVSKGYVSEHALNEEYIERGYGEEEQAKVKDLRGKLPESVQGPEVWAVRDFRKVTAVTKEDIKNNVSFEFVENYDTVRDSNVHLIRAKFDSRIIGVLQFSTNDSEKSLFISEIDVTGTYRNLGVAQLIYGEFGKVYSSKFNGYEVSRQFANPVAEYAFRKAVGDGLVPPEVLQENNIMREYDDDQENTINDLRGKLPAAVQGPEVWAAKDFRKVIASEELDGNIDITEEKSNNSTKYYLTYTLNDKEVAEFTFEAYPQIKLIDIEGVAVGVSNQNKGIATKLYEKFGEMYSQNFSGWDVKRWFSNPVAEYAFRKAVSEGKIPQEALQEDKIRRSYDSENKQVVNDLRGKLPPAVQGPEVWSSLRDFRKVEAALSESDVTYDVKEEFTENQSNGDFIKQWNIDLYDSKSQEKVGNMWFTQTYAPSENYEYIRVNAVEIYDKFQSSGYGIFLYKKFGDLYREQFSGYRVGRLFTNPVAEYTYRKAIELGYVPQEAFSEENTSRMYDKKDRELWKNELEPKLVDLRTKNLSTTSNVKDFRCITNVKQKLTTAAPKIDESDIEYEVNESTTSDIKGNQMEAITINLKYNKEYVAYLMFTVHPEEQKLYIENIEVWEVYQNQGLAQYAFKKFGELYNEKYSSWKVGLDFQNPAAETALNRAIEQGWVPQGALDDDNITRNY